MQLWMMATADALCLWKLAVVSQVSHGVHTKVQGPPELYYGDMFPH